MDDNFYQALAVFLMSIFYIAAFIAIVLLCFLPTFIAFKRRHPNRWVIFLVNLVFGFTVIGWVGSLIWAVHAVHKSENGGRGGESGLNIFASDAQRIRIEPIVVAASVAVNAPKGGGSKDDIVEQLLRLKALHTSGALTEGEYSEFRAPLVARLME